MTFMQIILELELELGRLRAPGLREEKIREREGHTLTEIKKVLRGALHILFVCMCMCKVVYAVMCVYGCVR